MNESPSYIKSLVTPTTKKAQGRKVWSIDLETVWIPFLTATNTQGDTAIPSQALGCPLRLGYDKAGAVRFSQNGRPLVKVAKEIGDCVRLVRDNFTANLLNYTGQVIRDNEAGFKAMVAQAKLAGEPLYQYDKNQLAHALKAQAEAEARAQAKAKAEAEAIAQAEAEAKAKAEAEAKPNPKSKQLVHA